MKFTEEALNVTPHASYDTKQLPLSDTQPGVGVRLIRYTFVLDEEEDESHVRALMHSFRAQCPYEMVTVPSHDPVRHLGGVYTRIRSIRVNFYAGDRQW